MGSLGYQFSARLETCAFAGMLFDMDGTIIDSTDAIVKYWHKIGEEIGVDPNVILQESHGRRAIDVLKKICPSRANWDYVRSMEGLLPEEFGDEGKEVPGASSLLDSLTDFEIPWGIVTSGTLPLVTGWLKVLGIPIPERIVTAEDVLKGKPDPTCYILGRSMLGLSHEVKEVLVLEDSPAGIRAGKKAGCKVLAVITTHSAEEILEAGADWAVKDLTSVRVVANTDNGVKLELRDALTS